MPVVPVPNPTPPLPGASYVSIAQVRAQPLIGTKYTDQQIADATAWFEAKWEAWVGMAFLPRTATERLHGSGRGALSLKHWPVTAVSEVRVYSSSTSYTAWTADELADLVLPAPTGVLRRYALGPWPRLDDLQITYTHGQPAPPQDIVDAALVAIQEHLLELHAGRPVDRQYSVATEAGIIRNSLPGDDRPFGLPAVDQVANNYRRRYKVPALA